MGFWGAPTRFQRCVGPHTSSTMMLSRACRAARETATTARAVRCNAVGSTRAWHHDGGAREGGDAAAMRAFEEARLRTMMMTTTRRAPVTMRGRDDVSSMHASFAMSGTREDDDDDAVDEGEDATARCPSDGGLGSKVLETWLMAVPKRKVTPSRRKRRNQFKRVPFIEEVVRCRVCGKANMPHVHCCDGLESVDRRPEPAPVTSSEI